MSRAVERGQGGAEYQGPSPLGKTRIGFACQCFVLVLVFKSAQGISHRYADPNQQVLKFDLQKKSHGLLIVTSMDVLRRGAGNFGHDPSLGKFVDFFQNF